MAEPDQGWASWLNQVRQHQPDTPIPPDAPTGSAPAQPVGTAARDSVPISVNSDAPPAAAPDVQQAAAVAAAFAAPAVTAAPVPSSSSSVRRWPTAPRLRCRHAAGVQRLRRVVGRAASRGHVGWRERLCERRPARTAWLWAYVSYGWYVVPSLGNDPASMRPPTPVTAAGGAMRMPDTRPIGSSPDQGAAAADKHETPGDGPGFLRPAG